LRRDLAFPARPLGKNAKKTLKKGQKRAKNAAKMGEKMNYRLSGVVVTDSGGQASAKVGRWQWRRTMAWS
jgi:hypothetical protein